MALTSYSELQAAIASWADRTDLSALVPDFISIFEAKMNRRLRVRQQLVSVSLSPVSGVVALPGDYLEWKRLAWSGDPSREIEYVEPTYIRAAYPDAQAGRPRFFSVEGANLLIRPVDDGDLDLQYYEKIAPLSDALNWLFVEHPDIYLFGSLTELCAFTKNNAGLTLWAGRAEQALAEIERLAQASRGQARIRAYGVTP